MVVAVVLSVLLAASAYAQMTDFFELAKTGTPQSIQAAIDKGANVNAREEKDQQIPLMFAAENNPNPDVITTLLKAGADIKARDKEGSTVLMDASQTQKNPAVISTLLNAGSDVN